MKKKDIKILSEAIEKNFFKTYNKIKRDGETILSEGAINEISPDDDYDAPEFEMALTYNYDQPADENSIEELIDSIGINYDLVGVPDKYHCDTYRTSLSTILKGMDLSKLEALKPNLIKASVWLDKNGEDIYEGTVYDWVVREFDAEIDEFARTADFQCYNNY